MLHHSGFSPVANSMGPTLKEESFHLFTGQTGLTRVVKEKRRNPMSQAAHTNEMDEHLKEVVQALNRAVNGAIPHAKDPGVADKAIQDCKEILDTVMEGGVSEWLDS